MHTPLVSIIIPTFNRVHLIEETLDSILSQTYKQWECIIVDDGSSDGTDKVVLEYCKKDARFQYYKRPDSKTKGANACRNYGFEISKGDYINWFDDDDIMHKDKLKLQVESLEKSDLNFTVCQTLVFENSIENIIGLRSKNIYSNNIFEDYLNQKIMWMTPSALWKKFFLEKFEYLFDEELQAAQEWEFHARMLFFSPNYDLVNTPLVYVRQHKESVSYNNEKAKRTFNYFKAREKVYYFLKDNGIRNDYLENYLISHYKYFLKRKKYNLALSILINQVIFNRNVDFMYRIKLLAAFFMYPIFKRGGMLFKGKPSQF